MDEVVTQGKLPRVLSVDDQRGNQLVIERLLRGCYEVTNMSSGKEALNALAQSSFDLVLLDIMMPEMNGLDVLQQIRSKPQTADLPVILVSALADSQDVSRGLGAGANDYITKPIDSEIALARIKTQITLKQLQDQRKQAIAELQEAHEMKDRFFQIASHDLKGPLMNIQIASGLLTYGPDEVGLKDIIDQSLESMQALIRDFLETAAVDKGELDVQIDAIPLTPCVDDLLSEHVMNARRKNIKLKVDGLSGVIRADRVRFRQALGNLVSNAIKYSPAHSTVTLWAEPHGDKVAIYVADQGPGIPADEQDKLFTQFGKLTPRPTAGESSTGLGLWIVKHLVALQNGQVGLISPPEGGSIFWIDMPMG